MENEFRIDVNQELVNENEKEILYKHGKIFLDLMNGERQPKTEAQKRFILVCNNEEEPVSKYEIVWKKYLNRKVWENDPENAKYMGEKWIRKDTSMGGDRNYYTEKVAEGGKFFSSK